VSVYLQALDLLPKERSEGREGSRDTEILVKVIIQRQEWRGERGDFKRQDADVSITSTSQANTAWLKFQSHLVFLDLPNGIFYSKVEKQWR
jgi:hypothetical protein